MASDPLVEEEKPLEIESLCMSCEEQGITRLIIKDIPMFKQVAIMSFYCEHCHHSNNQLQSTAPVEPFGIKFTLQVATPQDLNRQVVRGENATFSIPELEFEAPPTGSNGVLSTIEGLLTQSYDELEHHLSECPNTQENTEFIEKMQKFLQKYKDVIQLKTNFTFILDDPQGSSFVENPNVPNFDPNLTKEDYVRSQEQNNALLFKPLDGNASEHSTEENLIENESSMTKSDAAEPDQYEEVIDFQQEILTFKTNCSACGSDCDTNMKTVDIPYFQQVILMSSNCDACGYKCNEVKPSQGISDKGVSYKLKINDDSDLTRDVLKTYDASIEIPDLEVYLTAGTLGGKFTTLEGLIIQMHDQLLETCPFEDSVSEYKQKIKSKCKELMEIVNGKRKVTFILNDPTGNSYIQNFYAPDPDPHMEVTHYERNVEEKEDLGLNDMKTENYQAP